MHQCNLKTGKKTDVLLIHQARVRELLRSCGESKIRRRLEERRLLIGGLLLLQLSWRLNGGVLSVIASTNGLDGLDPGNGVSRVVLLLFGFHPFNFILIARLKLDLGTDCMLSNSVATRD